MKKFFMPLLAVLGCFIFSSCSFNILAPREIVILYGGQGAAQAVLTYTVSRDKDTQGFIFESEGMALSAYAKKGSVGVTLTGYRLEFFFADGSPVYKGDNSTLNAPPVRVPPGLTCERQELPGQPVPQECTINSKNVRYVAGPTVAWVALPGIPPQVARILFVDKRADNGAFARLTVFGTDDIGRTFELAQEISIDARGVFIPSSFDGKVD